MRPHPLAALVPRIASKALRRLGLLEPGLLSAWPDIVGPAIASATLPERLSFPSGKREGGVLHLRVEGAMAVELQHLAPLIVAKINLFLGREAVQRLSLIQRPLPKPPKKKSSPPANAAAERGAADDQDLAQIPDGELRQALADLHGALVKNARLRG